MARDIRITPKLNSVTTNDFPEIVFGGASASTIKLKVDDDGSVVYTGTYGVLFNVTDTKDGLLHSVNDVSGLPILQVYSYDYVQMGKWDKYTLVANSDKVGVGLTAPSSLLHVNGQVEITTGYGIKMGGSQFSYTAVALSRDVIDIGDWDMSNSATLAVGHNFGAEFIKIRSISGFIQDDSSTNMYPITFGKLDNSTDKFGVSVYQIDSTNFYLIHDNISTNFNNANFATTPFNRGWIVVEYIAPL